MYYVFISDEQFKIAESNGIRRDTLRARIDRGWKIERAITTPPLNKAIRYCPKVLELATKHGITSKMLYSRIMNCKMSPYKAATLPIQEKPKNPHETPEIVKKYLSNGISKQVFR